MNQRVHARRKLAWDPAETVSEIPSLLPIGNFLALAQSRCTNCSNSEKRTCLYHMA